MVVDSIGLVLPAPPVSSARCLLGNVKGWKTAVPEGSAKYSQKLALAGSTERSVRRLEMSDLTRCFISKIMEQLTEIGECFAARLEEKIAGQIHPHASRDFDASTGIIEDQMFR
ncbi:hypothetical protein U1Q18_051496 [Sarracenia purpurea var. burkii]